MKRVLFTSAIALLLLATGSAGAFAAPVTTAPAPDNAAWWNLQTVLTQTNQVQQNVVDQWEAARLQQVLALIQAGRPAEVEFAGMLQPAGAPGRWAVAGLVLGQSSATVFEGTPAAAGLHAHVQAQIHSDGTLEALRVHTMTHTSQTAAWQHVAEWRQDDHGIHLGGCQALPGGDHTAEHHSAQTPQHAAEPEHAARATTQQPAQPVHHAAAPAEHPAQPQPAAPQPVHHGEGSSGGGHDSGHHSGHD